MSENLTSVSVKDFVKELSEKSSVPGGGSAASLCGALGVALAGMVANFTYGKKRYEEYQDEIDRFISDADQIQRHLVELIDEDAQAFEPLSKAYSIDKSDPNRDAILEAATIEACRAPMKMIRLICRAILILEQLEEKGSKLLISDVGCGALLCEAALKAASLNVFVNTKTINDRQIAEAIDADCKDLVEQFVPKAQAIAKTITDDLMS